MQEVIIAAKKMSVTIKRSNFVFRNYTKLTSLVILILNILKDNIAIFAASTQLRSYTLLEIASLTMHTYEIKFHLMIQTRAQQSNVEDGSITKLVDDTIWTYQLDRVALLV